MTASGDGLRLMVYDQTCVGRPMLPGLSHAWGAGARLYESLGRLDAYQGVSSWEEAFAWLATVHADRPIAQVQYWGHGKWGGAKVGDQRFNISALGRHHELNAGVRALGQRMLPGKEGLLWFRTCETFGAKPGQDFASALADTLGCRIAGHTFIIGHWQSGLHTLLPGEDPTWSQTEGLREGTPEEPTGAFWSRAWKPNTINFLQGSIPAGY